VSALRRNLMQEDLIKRCPRCGSEYQLWVERCLDCDEPLVHGREGEGTAIAEPKLELDELAYPNECVHLRTAPPAWIGQLSEDLDEAGIRHWVSPPKWRSDPSLYVLPADLEAAQAIDQQRYAMEMPDLTHEMDQEARIGRPPRRKTAEYDPEVKVCPSCGDEYQLWAEKCADCGVPLVRPWDLDSARESEPRVAAPALAPLDDADGCPACGERLPEGALECPGCGLMLAQPDACPNCGVELPPHAPSCRRCGHEFFGSLEG
jgi:predicted amidophosphoribosyltransferase